MNYSDFSKRPMERGRERSRSIMSVVQKHYGQFSGLCVTFYAWAKIPCNQKDNLTGPDLIWLYYCIIDHYSCEERLCGGPVVSVMDREPWGWGFKSWSELKFGSRFMLHLRPLANSAMMSRAHSFPRARGISSRAAEFTAVFTEEFVFLPPKSREIWRFSFDQLFFHRKWPQSSSVTSLFMMIFCLMVMVEWWKWWLFEWIMKDS